MYVMREKFFIKFFSKNLPKMLLNPQALADRILLRMPDAEGVDGEVLSVISNV